MHPIKRHLLRDGAKRAALRVGMSLFGASVFSEKSFSRFVDCLRRLCAWACPFLVHSCFWKKAFGILWTVFGGFAARACPFLVHPCFRKKAFGVLGTVFGGFAARACPFLGGSCFEKNMVDDWQRVSKLYVFNPTRTPIRRRCRQNFPMMDGTCHLLDFSAIGRCRAPR